MRLAVKLCGADTIFASLGLLSAVAGEFVPGTFADRHHAMADDAGRARFELLEEK